MEIGIGLVIYAILGIIGIVVGLFILSGIVYVRKYEIGIVIKKMLGKKMSQGKIIACNGEIGVQAETLMPGLYWRNPFVYSVEKDELTIVNKGHIATVEAIDGDVISTGRLLADSVECNHFQDAKTFLTGGGKKGPQVSILKPGVYRINKRVFKTTEYPSTKITQEHIGAVTALDGKPLPTKYMIAPKPDKDDHNVFQDGKKFLDDGGYRGIQLDTLQAGDYYINPLLFKVEEKPVAEVLPGYVAVIVSNVGAELSRKTISKDSGDSTIDGAAETEIHTKDEVLLTTDKNLRGIWSEPVSPGKYNMNPYAFSAHPVPTSAVTIDWAAGSDKRTEFQGAAPGEQTLGSTKKATPKETKADSEKVGEFFKFSQLKLTSKDGFTLEADVRVIVRIQPRHAPFIIARFGSVSNLIEQIIHPLIDSSFRNNAGDKKAIDFIQSRTELQKDAFEKAKKEFEKYHVETQGLLISYIDVDDELLKTQTQKEIALQQKEQYQEQAAAQEEKIALQEKTARAEKQKDVVEALLSIDIEKNKAEATRRTAEGKRDATKSEAEGDAFKVEETGKALASAYKEQADVIGPANLALIKIMEQVKEGNIKIVPDFLVTGGGDNGGNLFQAWMANILKDQVMGSKENIKKVENIKKT